jgi:hypothetical protein
MGLVVAANPQGVDTDYPVEICEVVGNQRAHSQPILIEPPKVQWKWVGSASWAHLGHPPTLALHPNLMVLGARNTADRTIARMDIAIRRRFAFLEVWPDLTAVTAEGVAVAVQLFADTIHTFAEFADEETLRLIPGHAYFLDPRPDLDLADRPARVARRLQFELVPLLRDYLDERLCGGATEAIAGLSDRISSRVLGLA